jgi:hypothetical protein
MGMDKPSTIYPKVSTSAPAFMPYQIPDPSLRGGSFDQLLQQRGIRFIHKKALPCPNLKDLDQNTHDPLCKVCDGSGLLYYAAKEIWGIFYSNSLERMFEHHGVWEVGTAIVTLPTEYPDGTEADFNIFDQLEIHDFTVRLWELKEFVPTSGLVQTVRYPIQKVDYMASAENDVLKVYQLGTDFNVVDGSIVWVSGKQPSYDNINERGDVFVLAYFAHPVYTVLQHMRELRITQEMDASGNKVSKRLPQQVLVKRDHLYNSPEKEDK